MRISHQVIGCLASALLCFVLFASPARPQSETASAAVIGDVVVKVHLRTPVPQPLLDRIEQTARNVGLEALRGRTLQEAETLKTSVAQVMRKIFNEVLSGFQVAGLEVELGEQTVLELELEADQPVIESVVFETIPQAGIAEHWISFFDGRLRADSSDLLLLIAGTPVGSARWSEPLIAAAVRGWIAAEDRFPGFVIEPSVEIAANTVVRLGVRPASDTIRFVFVKTRSTTMPSLLLERLKFDLAAQSEFLVGLPVVFAEKFEDEIVEQFFHYLKENSQAQKFGLTFEIKPQFDKNSLISVHAESEKYSGLLRGKVSIGKEDRNPDIEGHFGVFIHRGTELFAEANFLPGPIDFQFNLGMGQRIGPKFYAAVGRNFVDGLNRVWLNYYVTEDVTLSWEKNVVDIDEEEIEGSITFKAHEYYSFDLVTDFHTDVWVRIVANL